jgi:hypothetical protein
MFSSGTHPSLVTLEGVLPQERQDPIDALQEGNRVSEGLDGVSEGLGRIGFSKL